MKALEVLSRDIVKFIYDQEWPTLRPIQEASIIHSQDKDTNLVLAAPTASGKTEAAFLPAINSVNDWTHGVRIVYVSPLKALINDQFIRMSQLCEYLDIPVTSWHGESSRSQKKKLVSQPRGVLLITPESVEAMLVHRPMEAEKLFANTEWIITDELHSFLDTSRGVHLKSLLSRIGSLSNESVRFVGMTATLSRDSYNIAKDFFPSNKQTIVLQDSSRNKLTETLFYEKAESQYLPPSIVDNIFNYSRNESMLVFPNSRGRVEEIAVGLKKRARKANSGVRYFAHHASVDKELRLEAEDFAKNSSNTPFTICCTSTLELGIDIGSVDSIAQVDGVPSVSSLAQRLGRSGRKARHSILHLYASKNWSLLQNIAALELYNGGIIEDVEPIKKPFNVLVQQIISLLLQFNSMSRRELVSRLKNIEAWGRISQDEMEAAIDHLLKIDYIENFDESYIVGLGAEKMIKSKDFYAHFDSNVEFSVVDEHKKIGEIPLSSSMAKGANIFLAANIWKITEIDIQTKKIYVKPAKDGKPPIFGGDASEVSHMVRRKMLWCLQNLDFFADRHEENVQAALVELSKNNLSKDGKDFLIKESDSGRQALVTFAGTKINRTILLMLKIANNGKHSEANFKLDDFESSIVAPDLEEMFDQIIKKPISSDVVSEWLRANEETVDILLTGQKNLDLLPSNLRIVYLMSNYFEVEATNKFIKTQKANFDL